MNFISSNLYMYIHGTISLYVSIYYLTTVNPSLHALTCMHMYAIHTTPHYANIDDVSRRQSVNPFLFLFLGIFLYCAKLDVSLLTFLLSIPWPTTSSSSPLALRVICVCTMHLGNQWSGLLTLRFHHALQRKPLSLLISIAKSFLLFHFLLDARHFL